jgi:cell division septum initiation protein DivIVA
MSFHPDDIAAREFFPAPDGYDRGEVRAYLRTVSSQQRELQAKVDELASQSGSTDIGGDVDRIVQSAKLAAEQLLRKAEMDAADLRHRAEKEASLIRGSTEVSTEKLRIEAEVYAGKVRSAIEQEANERLSHLARRADRVLAGEARIRDRMFSLETTLQTLRGELQSDAGALYPELPDALASMREMPAGSDDQPRAAIETTAAPKESRATLRDADPEPEIVINLNGTQEADR